MFPHACGMTLLFGFIKIFTLTGLFLLRMWKNDKLSVYWELKSVKGHVNNFRLRFELIDMDGNIVVEAFTESCANTGKINMDLNGSCRYWNPEEPVCYKIRVTAGE